MDDDTSEMDRRSLLKGAVVSSLMMIGAGARIVGSEQPDAAADPTIAYLRSSALFFSDNVAEAVRALPLAGGMRVLDAGTGGGVAIRPLATAVGEGGGVLAVDLNPKAIDLAKTDRSSRPRAAGRDAGGRRSSSRGGLRA